MNRRPAITLAIIIGLLAVSVPLASSIYLAWKQSYSTQMAQVDAIAKDVLRRADQSTDQVRSIFQALSAEKDIEPCSEASIRLMAKMDLASEQIQALGYVKDSVLLCSSYGTHQTPIGEPTYTTKFGTEVRTAVTFPVLPDKSFLFVTDQSSGYSVAIHPNLPLDVFVDEADVSIGVYSFASNSLVLGRGTYHPEWLTRLGDAQSIQFSDGKNLVAVHRSEAFTNAAFAAMPVEKVYQGLHEAAIILLPLGLLASALLVFAVVYVARQQMALPSLLKTALKRNELFMVYQPIVDLRTRRWVGAEALVRWRLSNGEMVRPDIFIAAAEEAKIIERVTERVMQLVAADVSQLFAQHPAFHIAINLSAADLQSRGTLQRLKQLQSMTGADNHNLMVEATERCVMNVDLTRDVVQEIRQAGIPVAIDDFGTGYSSLSSLQSFTFDYLKIDKSFVDTVGKNAATSQVVPHIIEMAKSLKLQLIAEGVETDAQAEYLQARGVEFAQGWLFAKPMSVERLLLTLANQTQI